MKSRRMRLRRPPCRRYRLNAFRPGRRPRAGTGPARSRRPPTPTRVLPRCQTRPRPRPRSRRSPPPDPLARRSQVAAPTRPRAQRRPAVRRAARSCRRASSPAAGVRQILVDGSPRGEPLHPPTNAAGDGARRLALDENELPPLGDELDLGVPGDTEALAQRLRHGDLSLDGNPHDGFGITIELRVIPACLACPPLERSPGSGAICRRYHHTSPYVPGGRSVMPGA